MIAPVRSWYPPPKVLMLGSDEVHVWRASLDLPASRVRWTLHKLPLCPGYVAALVVERAVALPRLKDVSDLLAYFSQPLPGVLLTHLRKLWRKHRNGLPAVLLSELQEFMQENPVVASDTLTDTKSVSEEELQLVCWLAVM